MDIYYAVGGHNIFHAGRVVYVDRNGVDTATPENGRKDMWYIKSFCGKNMNWWESIPFSLFKNPPSWARQCKKCMGYKR